MSGYLTLTYGEVTARLPWDGGRLDFGEQFGRRGGEELHV
jgi:hypothetical protein